ncbi:MAG: M48 family metalloprotease [Phycisphaerae bacterium]
MDAGWISRPLSLRRYEVLGQLGLTAWACVLVLLWGPLGRTFGADWLLLVALHVAGSQLFFQPVACIRIASLRRMGWRPNRWVQLVEQFLIVPRELALVLLAMGFGWLLWVTGFLPALWIAALVLPGFLIAGDLISHRRSRRGDIQPVQEDPLASGLQDAAARLGHVDVWVELCEAGQLPGALPAACFQDGVIRIDRDLARDLPREQVEAIFLHELAHHAGKDSLWTNLLSSVSVWAEVVAAMVVCLPLLGRYDGPVAAAVFLGPLVILAFRATGLLGLVAENVLSRFQERRAHRTAARWMQDAETYLAAMAAVHPAGPMRPPHRLSRWLLDTHPSLQQVADLVRRQADGGTDRRETRR